MCLGCRYWSVGVSQVAPRQRRSVGFVCALFRAIEQSDKGGRMAGCKWCAAITEKRGVAVRVKMETQAKGLAPLRLERFFPIRDVRKLIWQHLNEHDRELVRCAQNSRRVPQLERRRFFSSRVLWPTVRRMAILSCCSGPAGSPMSPRRFCVARQPK